MDGGSNRIWMYADHIINEVVVLNEDHKVRCSAPASSRALSPTSVCCGGFCAVLRAVLYGGTAGACVLDGCGMIGGSKVGRCDGGKQGR